MNEKENEALAVIQDALDSEVECVLGDVAECLVQFFEIVVSKNHELVQNMDANQIFSLLVSILATLTKNFDKKGNEA